MIELTSRQEQIFENKMSFFNSISYNPHGKQIEAHRAAIAYRFIMMAAGARGGKSMWGGAEICYHFCRPDYDSRIWCVGPHYGLADKEYLWFMHFLARIKLKSGKRFINSCRISNNSKGPQKIISPNGAFVETKSFEKPRTLLGESVDLIVGGEFSQAIMKIWERFLSMRLSDRLGSFYAPSTPAGDFGPFADFFSHGQSDDPAWSDWWSILFSTENNPYIDKSELARQRAGMDPDVAAEQIDGKFVPRRGRVFKFDEKRHVYSNIDVSDFPLFLGVRQKQNNPLVVLFVRFDRINKTYYIDDEIYIAGGTVKTAKQEIKTRLLGHKVFFVATDFFDPLVSKDLDAIGMVATKNISEQNLNRNQAEIRRLQLAQNLVACDRLKINHTCLRCIDDFQNCSWPDSRDDRGRENAELPLDLHIGGPKAFSFAALYVENNLL